MYIQYIKGAIGIAILIVIVSLSITISCQRDKITGLNKSLESASETEQQLRNDVERLQARAREESKIRDKESSVIERLFIKTAYIKEECSKDIKEIEMLKEDPISLDWLDATIPDDVRKLLQDITHRGSRVYKD